MKASIILISLLGLAACSEVPSSPYSGANQPRVVPDGMSVTVANVHSAEEAAPWAEAYCTKRGRVAHFVRMGLLSSKSRARADSAFFDCVSG